MQARSIFGMSFVGAIALITYGAGCELVANVDRSKIPGSGGGAAVATASSTGGAGPTTSAGGQGGAGAATSSSASNGGGGAGAASSSSSSASTGGGGSGGGIPVMCKDASKDCPATNSSCGTPACDIKGLCTVNFANKGTACTDNGGTVCDGSGDCVACNTGDDCPAQTTACVLDTCISNACGTENANPGAPCTDNGGALCDGNGSCVQCLQDKDCPNFPSDVCKQNNCIPASCTDMKQDGDETDVDCGGSCNPCANTKDCAVDTDCQSGFCSSLVCAPCGQDSDCSTGQFCDTKNNGGTCTATNKDGTTCTGNDQCSSGFCVDGVCCDTSCTGTCQACTNAKKGAGVDGTCGTIKVGTDPDNECTDQGAPSCKNTGVCDGNGACQDYAAGTVCAAQSCSGGTQTNASTCNGSGTCNPGTPPTKSCAPYICSGNACSTSCNVDTDCATGNFCNASHQCAAMNGNGTACGANTQCTSGNCVDGVCCNSSCAGLCQACTAAKKGSGVDGTCGAIAAGSDPDNECADQGAASCGNDGSCNGSGACRDYASGTQCLAQSCTNGQLTAPKDCNGTGACSVGGNTSACPGGVKCADATSCLASCSSDTDCQSSSDYCSGGVCVPKNANGGACGANDQCTSNVCGVAGTGHCCTVACSPTGGTCGASDCDASGACIFAGVSTQCAAPSCSNGQLTTAKECNGFGACSVGGSTGACPGGLKCADATSCLASCSTDTDCESSNDYCSGGVCVPKGGAGVGCTASDQCSTGFCVEGICCNTNCTDEGAASCGQTGACDGSGNCELYSATTECISPSCNSGVETQPGFCDGAGTCDPGSTGACPGDVKCKDASSCLPSCVADTDCELSSDYCNGGACTPREADSQACTSADECTSGNCVDGFCCNTSCAGNCVACNVAGSVGTCSPVSAGTPDPGCGGEVCNGSGSCVQCVNNSECSGATPKCNTATDTCVQCLVNSDCPGGQTCNASNQCVALAQWFFANYSGAGTPPVYNPAQAWNGTVNCATTCGEHGLTATGARFVCNMKYAGFPDGQVVEGCTNATDGQYGTANCGELVDNGVLTTENGNTEDCASESGGPPISGCVTGSCQEFVSYHALQCQCH